MAERSAYDCVIVGGGPAGLSAALILGRCRRQVLVCDSGQPRNAHSRELHGFLTRDCVPPLELLHIGREQLRRYPTVEYQPVTVVDGRCRDRDFELSLEDGSQVTCRRLLLATGVIDELPEVEGLRELYGRSVFHCPYCDGWEHRDLPLAVYGKGKSGAGLTLTLSLWSKDLVLCTDGPGRIPPRDKVQLAERGVVVRSERIARLEGTDGLLERIVFSSGEAIPRRAMFVITKQQQHSDLAAKLGCAISPKRSVETGRLEMTSIPGLYVAGDASRDVQLVIVAAAEGAKAAFAINKGLLDEELKGK